MNSENETFSVVFDTNVFVSAFQFGGLPLQLFEMAIDREFNLVISEEILKELYQVLKKKFKRTENELDEIIDLILANSSVIKIKRKISIIKEKDSDNRILECALAANASFIITGDTKHLLPLKKFKNVEILPPREFVSRLEKGKYH